MQLAFGWYNILELLFCLVALWMGIRDLQGKDPPIHTFSINMTATRNTAPCGRRKRRVGDLQCHYFCFPAVSGQLPYLEQLGAHHCPCR